MFGEARKDSSLPSLPRFADFVKALWALQGDLRRKQCFCRVLFELPWMMEANKKNPGIREMSMGLFLWRDFC